MVWGMGRPTRTRAFRRDDFLSIRLPGEAKDRLKELARQKLRDTSNLALEYIAEGLRRDEAELRGFGQRHTVAS
jgi:hypothetical protein